MQNNMRCPGLRLAIIILWLCYTYSANAQRQNENWCFAKNRGINFSGNTPAVINGVNTVNAASATVSDKNTGSLLFYSDGMTVWNKNHLQMPNGFNIGVINSNNSSQGVIIIPDPADDNLHYVFCVEGGGTSPHALYYSVVDMRLDGAMGDVIATKKRIKLGEDFGELMTVVQGDDCSIWLLTIARDPA